MVVPERCLRITDLDKDVNKIMHLSFLFSLKEISKLN